MQSDSRSTDPEGLKEGEQRRPDEDQDQEGGNPQKHPW